MRKVRNGTFETNSSSTHALVFPSSNIVRDQTLSEQDYSFDGNFLEFDFKTNDVVDKINFLYAAICEYHGKDKELLDKLEEAIHLHCPNVNFSFVALSDNVYFDRGHFPLYLFKSVDALQNFLFSSQAFLYYGDDNWLEDKINADLGNIWTINV